MQGAAPQRRGAARIGCARRPLAPPRGRAVITARALLARVALAAPRPQRDPPGPAMLRRALALAVLLLAAVAAHEPVSTPDGTSAEGQTQESLAEPVSPAKLEASGESDLSTAAQRPGKGAGAGPAGATGGSDSSSLDALSSGSLDAEAAGAAARTGPGAHSPGHSEESQEGAERDLDSEEAPASQGI